MKDSPFGTTREGWPLLTVETEANEDSKTANARGPFLVGSFGFLGRYKVLSWLGCPLCPVVPVQTNFFLTVTFFPRHVFVIFDDNLDLASMEFLTGTATNSVHSDKNFFTR